MKIFIINLEHQTEKRQFMQEQLDRLGLEAEFIAAVNGKSMSADQLREAVYNYDDCCLTAGEVGCSLSHISIYKKMVSENIKHALILEDDALLSDDLPNVLTSLELKGINHKPHVYLLTSPQCYNELNPTQIYGNYQSFELLDAWNAHGYVMNIKAASKMAKALSPIFLVADHWKHFKHAGYTNISCIIPALVSDHDPDKIKSDLEADRSLVEQKRDDHYQAIAKNSIPFYQYLNYHLKRIIKKPITKKKWL
ncbi:glycosyltransferase family 25 protein [Neisseriaceae bacterium CLB008]